MTPPPLQAVCRQPPQPLGGDNGGPVSRPRSQGGHPAIRRGGLVVVLDDPHASPPFWAPYFRDLFGMPVLHIYGSPADMDLDAEHAPDFARSMAFAELTSPLVHGMGPTKPPTWVGSGEGKCRQPSPCPHRRPMPTPPGRGRGRAPHHDPKPKESCRQPVPVVRGGIGFYPHGWPAHGWG